MTGGSDADFGALLAHIRDARGYDFTGYKPSSLQRRLQKRMEAVGVDSYEEYRDLLEVQPAEFAALFDTLLINVTAFFRDPEAWDALRAEAISELLQSRADDGQIRAWSAGTASGEEAYTLAMLLAEALGEEAYLQRVKIYATDVDDRALEEARHALYDAAALEAVPEDLRERYFEPSNGRWCFRRDLRRTIIFGRNDLVRDAPISRIDLLVCRNTLMYFNSETQGDILRRFHFALQPTGFLFLGKSEMLLTRRDLFEPVSLKRRLFRKVVHVGDRRGPVLVRPADRDPGTLEQSGAVARRAFEAAPAAQILIGRDRLLRLANDAARKLLRLGIPDIGRPLQDLEVSYRPLELRAALDLAFSEGRALSLGPVRHRQDDREHTLEIQVAPLPNGSEPELVSVTYVDITARLDLEQELERAKRELGAAYEELQSTVEELETTNEELQTTNEELETTNEELQSTNEELETMNEELQSANEELETINDEMRQRSITLDEMNAVMEAILSSMGVGVVIVDRQERIHLWDEHSEELWGLRRDEALGSRVTELDIGLPVQDLQPSLRAAVLDGGQATTIEVPARDRRGREFLCEVRIVPLKLDGGDVAAVVLAQRRDGA